MATNERLYLDVAYQTRIPGDRELFVAPLVDARTADDLPVHDRGFPISYGSDGVWERPVRDMVDEILARQLGDSGLFHNIVSKASPQSLVLAPSLEKFTTGAVEAVGGARAFAEVGLRLRVLGAVDAGTGERPVLYDETFSERQITEPSMRPVSPYLLVGVALRTTMQKTLTGLDTSNVGRSFVPAIDDGRGNATATASASHEASR